VGNTAPGVLGVRRVMAAVCFAAMALLCFSSSASAQEKPEACILRLDSMITEAYARAVMRYVKKAEGEGIKTFILELDTPGGYLAPSMELSDFILRREDIDVIAYVNDEAYSGGTMVALACKAIYIDKTTGRMGDAAPVGPTGQIIGEKMQAPVRLTMGGYAKARGYPEALVKAMVTKEIEVYRVTLRDDPTPQFMTGAKIRSMSAEEQESILTKEIIVPAGRLFAMDAEMAVEYGFARQAVRSKQQLYDLLGLRAERVRREYLTGSEKALTILDMFTPLLIAAGLALLYLELLHPGLGLPGILGLGCFVVFFLVKWTLHYAHMLEMVLFIAGVVLLLLEIFIIPGFGLAGGLGLGLLFVSLVLAFQQFAIPRTGSEFRVFQWNLLKVTGSLLASAALIAVLVRFMPSIPVLQRLVNRRTMATVFASEGLERHIPDLAHMVGKSGVALTTLRPAGRAEFRGVRLDVVTEGDFIEKGERVQVLAVHGSRIVVGRHEEF